MNLKEEMQKLSEEVNQEIKLILKNEFDSCSQRINIDKSDCPACGKYHNPNEDCKGSNND